MTIPELFLSLKSLNFVTWGHSSTTQKHNSQCMLVLLIRKDFCLYHETSPLQPKFKNRPFFPAKVSDLDIGHELKSLMAKCDGIFHATGMPMVPCVFHHFCLPFSPICAMAYCASRQKSQLDEVVRQFNEEVATPRGIFVMWNSDFYSWLSGGAKPGSRKKLASHRAGYCTVYCSGL